jgi:hypothetical protein
MSGARHRRDRLGPARSPAGAVLPRRQRACRVLGTPTLGAYGRGQPRMPHSPPSRCSGCGALLARGERCQACNWVGSRYGRGGPSTSDPRWRRLRSQRLHLDPFCVECGQIADQVDHVDGTDYDNDSGTGLSWLSIEMTRSLCTPCHRSRTGKQGAAARQRSQP